MEETVSADVQGEKRLEPPRARNRLPLSTILSFVVGLVGIVALAATGWVYSQTQREIVRLSTDIAELRLSMELYGRQQATPTATDDTDPADLANRLAILEENWRNSQMATPAPALPPLAAPATTGAVSNEDCLPTSTLFLVSAGDSYPVCGTPGKVEIGAVDNGFVTLADGSVIASGGNIPLPGTACMIGVASAGENGMTGFAEIRVTC